MEKHAKGIEFARKNDEQPQARDAREGAVEVRLLEDLELVLASGGDITPTWP